MQTIYIGNTLINDVFLGSQRMDDLLAVYKPTDQSVINFSNATGITSADILQPLNTFVTTLKSNGIWNKLYAIYPFVGSDANSNKYNLINTGSYTGTFGGGWTYNSNGVTGNGSTNYFNTTFNPASSVTGFAQNHSLSFYSKTAGNNGYDLGIDQGGSDALYVMARYVDGKAYYGTDGNINVAVTSDEALGFFTATISGSNTNNKNMYRNSTAILTGTNTTYAAESSELYFGANHRVTPDGITDPSSRNYAYASIGKGLTSSEVSSYYTAVQTLQTSLNRQV